MKYISEYLQEDIEKFRAVYQAADKYQKINFKARLYKYEWQFKSQKDFLKWYFAIVN
jgi:hypothetical protein